MRRFPRENRPAAAKEVAEKVQNVSSGAKARDENAGFMSELKLRPPKEHVFFRGL